jgi:hypothetical protein
MSQMAATIPIIQATDYSTPLVLELNEITVLMGLNAVGIIFVMALSIFVSISAFFGKESQGLSEAHFTRK